MTSLSDQDLAILRSGLLPAQQRACAALDLGMSETRLLQRFLLLIDEPAAAEVEPEIIERAKRMRAQRAARRRMR